VPADAARHAIWVAPRLVGLAEFTGFVAGGRLRLPHWRGLAPQAEVDLSDRTGPRWARPPEPPPHRTAAPQDAPAASPPAGPVPEPAPPETVRPAAAPAARVAEPVTGPVTEPAAGPVAAVAAVEERRLEQHFVYNTLNTIASLIRTDPGRARELLIDFADLSRAADQSGESVTTLGRELDAVRGYLQLEQARFGKRLRVELEIDPALHAVPVGPMRLLGAVRDAVQRDIEPRPQGGVLTLSARAVPQGCEVRIVGGAGAPVVLLLPAAGAPV
jgi:hypothetical protein